MKKVIRIIVVVCILAALGVGYYWYLSNHTFTSDAQKEEGEISELQDIILTDLSTDYPKSPRAVMKLYNRILTLYYNEDLSEQELLQLFRQQRELFDDEMIAANPEDAALESLKLEITGYKDANKSMRSAEVSDSRDVSYKTVDGRECAFVNCTYFIREDNAFTYTYMQYCLREDEEDGRWKIIAYWITDAPSEDD